MNNGRAGKALAGMNALRGAAHRGRRSLKKSDQRREVPTPAAHQTVVTFLLPDGSSETLIYKTVPASTRNTK